MSRPGGAVTVRAARNASRPRATVPGTKPPGIRAREGHLQSATHSCVTYGPYVTQHRKEGPHMSTKSALRADLDAEDRKTLAEDRKRMERLGKGADPPANRKRSSLFRAGAADAFDGQGRLAGFFGDQAVLLFDHGASGGVAVETAEDFARN